MKMAPVKSGSLMARVWHVNKTVFQNDLVGFPMSRCIVQSSAILLKATARFQSPVNHRNSTGATKCDFIVKRIESTKFLQCAKTLKDCQRLSHRV